MKKLTSFQEEKKRAENLKWKSQLSIITLPKDEKQEKNVFENYILNVNYLRLESKYIEYNSRI